ncbi:MAG: aspartyl protease family protein [Acidobacteriota bacterium]
MTTGSVLGVCLVVAAVVHGAAPPPSVSFPSGQSSVEVRVTVFNNVVYVPVAVNGGDPLLFALDTGAPELSAVSLSRADGLGLASGEALTVRGSQPGRMQVRDLEGVVLSVAGIDAQGLRVIAMPLERLEPYWGHPMDGILGGNFLRQVVTCIDYGGGRVRFVEPSAIDGAEWAGAVPLEVEDNTLFVSARVTAGDGSSAGVGRFLIDTGVRQSFVNTPFVRRHRLIERSGRVVETVTGFGISGLAVGLVGRLGSIALGSQVLTGPIIQLCTEDSGIAASSEFDGILGADILSRFRVCFDYGRKRMLLEATPAGLRPFHADASGLVFRLSDDGSAPFSVAFVVEASPAAGAGVQVGDGLVAVNQRPAGEFSLESLKSVLAGPGEACLRLRRDAEEIDLCIALQPLI